ncbi:MAG: type I DNA topoisomerase [Candidatus Omnitrophica bacterium]|nr:type I DNA topoisomerase [Candidatus Omnitrophota bacterium]MDD5552392.1 type I DNA topoisomerase [Candidatus Omnitrophota bacterium]
MAKKDSLVIVESPTKAKTISRILGDKFSVIASMGHVIDLPEKELGVDVEKDFEPSYVIVGGREKIVSSLEKESKGKKNIYVATDPDREGEAIGWHIMNWVFKNKKVQRVIFHEITVSAVKEAFGHPRDFDLNMVEAQAGRRILDRLVGYFLSPLLWKKIVRGLSAGRVQSVALRLIVDREKQIKAFVAQEYWEIEAELKKVTSHATQVTSSFLAKLEKIGDKKAEIRNKAEADHLVSDLKDNPFTVSEIKKTERKRYPYPPFITSTLQQEAFNKLRYNAGRTMMIAQQLYEGIDIGEEAPVGLITYMRTDSTNVAPEAIKGVRSHIQKNFGKEYLPDEPNVYKLKKHAQAAHEAIRPSLISHSPQSLESYLTADQYKLYELIYRRFIASQMTPARFLVTTANIAAGKYTFSASGTTPIFDGFMAVYNNDAEEKEKNIIPELEQGENLRLEKLMPSQHFTKPPARFSDSSLVKALEEEGIGRPSTYAPIIQTLVLRDYARRIKGYFFPTELGFKVCDMLVEYFPKVMDIKFTALMEGELDEIEEGRAKRLKVLQDFYPPFKESLDYAQKNIKKEVVKTDEVCKDCGSPMIIKWGRKGKFLSCSAYPKCKNAKSITTGVKCPQEGCGGELIERHSRRGFFYGCSNYPKCTFISKTLPQEEEKGGQEGGSPEKSDG